MVRALLLNTAATANDSSAELAAGGLVLVKTNKVAIQREDLSLSPDTVKVRYEMRNDTAAPVTLHVAFPLPVLPVDTPAGFDLLDPAGTSTAHNIHLPSEARPNFVNFRVWADGREIAPDVEIRAVLPSGRDIAGRLRDMGAADLLLHPRILIVGDPDYGIDRPLLHELQNLGAVSGDAGGAAPLWQTRVTFHWQQTFPPGVMVIEHSYRPVVGSSFVARQNDVWTGGAIRNENLEQAYCLDKAAKQTIGGLQQDGGLLGGQYLDYVLSSGANWAGLIGTFHLMVDAGAAEVLALCSDVPLHRSGKGRLEGQKTNYTPTKDLRVLWVQ
jgi:hypothetical protein